MLSEPLHWDLAGSPMRMVNLPLSLGKTTRGSEVLNHEGNRVLGYNKLHHTARERQQARGQRYVTDFGSGNGKKPRFRTRLPLTLPTQSTHSTVNSPLPDPPYPINISSSCLNCLWMETYRNFLIWSHMGLFLYFFVCRKYETLQMLSIIYNIQRPRRMVKMGQQPA